LRPVSEKASEISSVPYDVIYESEVRDTLSRTPESFLSVTRPDGLFPEGARPSDEEMQAAARQSLAALRSSGNLIEDSEDSIYVYRLSVGGHSQTGFVACCSVDDYENDVIKRHEKTRPDKVKDRTDHMVDLGAQTGLVFLAFKGTVDTREIISQTVTTDPLYDFTAPDGVRHTVWKVGDSSATVKAFGDIPSIYIADGHHRVESARVARERLRETNPNHTGDESYNYFIAGIFPAEDLKILPYNRAVKDLNGLSQPEFFERIKNDFELQESDLKAPIERGKISMYLAGRWYTIKSKIDDVQELGPIERLDVSILQDRLLNPVLGIDDPRTNQRVSFIGGARGTDTLEKLIDSGDAAVAFSMFATTMEDLFAVSDIGEIMPPKSTWFEPKLRDGLLVHLI
jgi:uncharacterized protein (DUF1015 family)